MVAVGPDGQQIGVVFETATPFDTPRLMSELFEWLAKEEREPILHPLLRIAVFNPLFPALRSVPLALSGASRQKQIPWRQPKP